MYIVYEGLGGTYAIFSDGDRQGTSSSSSSSLSSPSSPSSLPDALKEDDVNMSGTGKMDGRRLPTIVMLIIIFELKSVKRKLSRRETRI